MSETLMLNAGKPKPQFTSAAPDFKMGGLLPATHSDVLRNYRVQKRAYNEFEQQAAIREGRQKVERKCCRKSRCTICMTRLIK